MVLILVDVFLLSCYIELSIDVKADVDCAITQIVAYLGFIFIF